MGKGLKPEQGSFLWRLCFREVAFPFIMALMSGYLWIVADGFQGGSARYEAIGPDFFPKLILGASILMCIILGGRAFWLGRSKSDGPPDSQIQWGRLFAAAVITFAYAAALSHLGFLAATLAFQVLLLAVVFRVRRPKVLVLAPVALTTILILVFAVLMHVPLPRGSGAFAAFSSIFY